MFTTYFNKLKTLNFLPSYFHKNRLWIERDAQKKKIFFLWTFTKRAEKWANYERENVVIKFLSFQYNWIAYAVVLFLMLTINEVVRTSNVNLNFLSYLFWLSSDLIDYLTLYTLWITYFLFNSFIFKTVPQNSTNVLNTSLINTRSFINLNLTLNFQRFAPDQFYKNYYYFIWLQTYNNFALSAGPQTPFFCTKQSVDFKLRTSCFFLKYPFQVVNYLTNYNVYTSFCNTDVFITNNRRYLNFIKANYWKKTLNLDFTSGLTYWTEAARFKTKTILNSTKENYCTTQFYPTSSNWLMLQWMHHQLSLLKIKLPSPVQLNLPNRPVIQNTYLSPLVYNYAHNGLFSTTSLKLVGQLVKTNFFKQTPIFSKSASKTFLY